MTSAKAEAALDDAGLSWHVKKKPVHDADNVGLVLEQSLPDTGSDVQLIVGVTFPEVPFVRGMQLAHAKAALKKAGYKVRVVRRNSTLGRNWEVVGQTPAGGTEMLEGKVVSLVALRNICTPGYYPCLPRASDYDCPGGDGPYYAPYTHVYGDDPYQLDDDSDGLGCE